MSAPPLTRAGTIRSALDLEQATRATLQASLPAYLDEAGQQAGLAPPLVRPASYTLLGAVNTDRFAEEQLPAIVVTSPGLLERPQRAGDGSYAGWFGLGVFCYLSASTQEATHALARVWCAAIATCLLQQPSLGGVCGDLGWELMSYHEQPPEDRRTLVCGVVGFRALLVGLLDAYAGPLPPADLFPTVALADVVAERVELDEEV